MKSYLRNIYTYSLMTSLITFVIIESIRITNGRDVTILDYWIFIYSLIIYILNILSIYIYKKNIGKTRFTFKHLCAFLLPVSWVYIIKWITYFERGDQVEYLFEEMSPGFNLMLFGVVFLFIIIINIIPFLFFRKKKYPNKIDVESSALSKKVYFFIIILPVFVLSPALLETEHGTLTSGDSKKIYKSFIKMFPNLKGTTEIGACSGNAQFEFDGTRVTIEQTVNCGMGRADQYGEDSYNLRNFYSEIKLIEYNQKTIPVWEINGELDDHVNGHFSLELSVSEIKTENTKGDPIYEDRVFIFFMVWNSNWTHSVHGSVSLESGEKLLEIFKIKDPLEYIKEVSFLENEIDLGYYFSGFYHEDELTNISEFNEEQFIGSEKKILRKIVRDTTNLDYLVDNISGIESTISCYPWVYSSNESSFTVNTISRISECDSSDPTRTIKNSLNSLDRYGKSFHEEEFNEKMIVELKTPFYNLSKNIFTKKFEVDVTFKTKLYNYYGQENPLNFVKKFNNNDPGLLKIINSKKKLGEKRLNDEANKFKKSKVYRQK